MPLFQGSSALVSFMILLLLFQAVTCGPFTYGLCQAGCAGVVVACFSAAGFTFGTVPGAIIAATPALAGCNTAYAACYTACSALIVAPIP